MGNTAKKDARAADIAERQRKGLELRKSGASYEQIAKTLGHPDKSNARRDVQDAILAIIEEPAREVLQLELERLDRDLQRCEAAHDKLEARVNLGDEKAIASMLKIIEATRHIQERRAAYLGLDAPKKVQGDMNVTGLGEFLAVAFNHER